MELQSLIVIRLQLVQRGQLNLVAQHLSQAWQILKLPLADDLPSATFFKEVSHLEPCTRVVRIHINTSPGISVLRHLERPLFRYNPHVLGAIDASRGVTAIVIK